MLGISEHTIRAWRQRGVGPSYRHMGRNVRYNHAEVQDWHDRTLVPERPFKRARAS
ncbi:MAG: Helix-turn-helix domain [Desertimonas sp.]|jgi:predicted DNA-binding transcriptional regulator AlpA|nr:Helix-turn-helix domain [Desertimonas sp.]